MNALIPVNAAPPMPVSDVERIASAFAQSGMFGVRDSAAAMSLCLLAQAEGQHPAIAFRDYSIIQGKPAKKAEAMQRDFLQSGGKIEWLELSDTCVKAKFSHPAGGTATVDWTMERAKIAGLGGKDNWRKFPRQMLRSRVISEGVRTVCPMATSGMYVPEEVAEFDNQAATTIEAPANETVGEFTEVEHVERQKVPGISKIKERLNAFMREGNSCTDIEEFRKLVKANKDDIKTVRDANHEYWTGDGADWEGFGKWMEGRYADLTPPSESDEFTMLRETLDTCTSSQDLTAWFKLNAKYVETLVDPEQDRIKGLYDEKEAALKLLDQATVGA